MSFEKPVNPLHVPRPPTLEMHGGSANGNKIDSKAGAAFFRTVEAAYKGGNFVLIDCKILSLITGAVSYEAWLQNAGPDRQNMAMSDLIMTNFSLVCSAIESGVRHVQSIKDEIILADGHPRTVHITVIVV